MITPISLEKRSLQCTHKHGLANGLCRRENSLHSPIDEMPHRREFSHIVGSKYLVNIDHFFRFFRRKIWPKYTFQSTLQKYDNLMNDCLISKMMIIFWLFDFYNDDNLSFLLIRMSLL